MLSDRVIEELTWENNTCENQAENWKQENEA